MRSADFKRRKVCLRPGASMAERCQPCTWYEELIASTRRTDPIDRTDPTTARAHTDPMGHTGLTLEIIGSAELARGSFRLANSRSILQLDGSLAIGYSGGA